MIRKFELKDLEKVMKIWLISNIEAHSFIDQKYWENNFRIVKEMIIEAEVYVYEENNSLLGFIGLQDHYIAGIFVESFHQGKGIGKQLLDYVKRTKKDLSLNVYEENFQALNFYLKNGFKIHSSNFDEENQVKEYLMITN